jgi:succinoglycan biosynthesis transport protein ExoP
VLETSRENDSLRRRGPAQLAATDEASPFGGSDVRLSTHLRVLYRRRWLGLLVMVLAAAAILGYTWLEQPVYEARVRLVVDPEPAGPVPFGEVGGQQTPDLATVQQALRSRELARRTVNALQLWTRSEFADAGGSLVARVRRRLGLAAGAPDTRRPDSADEASQGSGREPANDPRAEQLVDGLLRRLRVEPVPLSRVVDVFVQAEDPALTAEIANTLAQQFIQQDIERRFELARQSTAWLEARLAEQMAKLQKSEAALQEFKERSISVGNPQNIVVQKLADLNAAVTRARTDRLAKEAVFNQLQAAQRDGAPLDSVPAIASNAVIQQLRAEVGALQRQRSELSQQYGERHPEMVRVQSALAQTQERLKAEISKAVQVVENEYRAAVAQERSLTAALESQKGEALRLSELDLEYGRLQREAQASRQIYDTLLQQARQLGIASELKQSAARVLDPARPPSVPIRPNWGLSAVLALVAGVFLGVGAVFAREHLDPRLKTPEDILRQLKLPFLGLIPTVETADNRKLLPAGSIEHPAFVEPLRRIRANLELLAPPAGTQVLLVTSTGPREGKTTLAVGLATSLARAGRRVLVVDGDLWRPEVHRALGIPRKPGLADFLTGKSEIDAIIHPTPVERLSAIAAGTLLPREASDLVGRSRLDDLIQGHLSRYDWIIFDSPPVMSVPDAALLARRCTGVLFVIGAGMVAKEAAQKAIEQLMAARARFAGAVLNRAALERHPYYYFPYYSPKYQSYYDVGEDGEPGPGPEARPT